MRVGERVGAVMSVNDTEVSLFGYGVYDGDHPPIGCAGFIAERVIATGITNPRITLDSGEVVWGCECWWGPEDNVKKMIGTRNVTMVIPSEMRKRVAGAS